MTEGFLSTALFAGGEHMSRIRWWFTIQLPDELREIVLNLMFPFSRHARWEVGRQDGLSYRLRSPRKTNDPDYHNGYQWGREQSDPVERHRRLDAGEPEPFWV